MNNITGLRFYINEDLNLVVDDHRGKAVKHKVISLHSFCKLVEKFCRGDRRSDGNFAGGLCGISGKP